MNDTDFRNLTLIYKLVSFLNFICTSPCDGHCNCKEAVTHLATGVSLMRVLSADIKSLSPEPL